MNQFDRLEAMAQQVIEGTFQRFFHAKQPSIPPTQPITEAEQRTETRELRLNAAHKSAGRWLLNVDERLVPLGEPVIDIGRALDNDIVLTDPTVSRYHAQLRWREGRYYLCPPRPVAERTGMSYTGQTAALHPSLPHTLVNDQPILEEPCVLTSGDVITLGCTTITLGLAQE